MPTAKGRAAAPAPIALALRTLRPLPLLRERAYSQIVR
jgi:hypothetical protein